MHGNNSVGRPIKQSQSQIANRNLIADRTKVLSDKTDTWHRKSQIATFISEHSAKVATDLPLSQILLIVN